MTSTLPHVKESLTLKNARAMADAPAFLLGAAQRHGPAFRVDVGPVTLTIVAEPALLQQVLQKDAKRWGRGTAVDSIRPLLGNGLPLSDPPLWLTQRRTMQPSFHKAHGPSWVHAMRDIAASTLDALKPGEELRTRTLMMHIARDVIVRAMFSQSMSDVKAFDHALEEVEAFVATSLNPLKLPMWVPTPTHLRFKRSTAFLHAELQRVITERRALADPPHDLLTLLIRATDPETGTGMSDQQLRDEVMNIFFAGHETTANLMTWATWLLAKHPEVRERVEAEVQSVLGARAPEPEDLPKLTLVSGVIRETLRLFPPAWLFIRQALEDADLGGLPVKQGEVVMVLPWITHRLEKYWKEPERFDPSRFDAQPSTDAATWKYAYLPFGAGPHVCIGNHFALLEATVVLAMLAQRGRLEPTSPQTVKPKMGATLLVADGLPARFVRHAARA